ncbi:SHOCT domain-containing protein [Gottfriedia luciferensis]|uniref:SHOCT domain-containing protein n=1 Tax=Gottfriedia luciferensis TaxID=178774 RepID=UPI000B444F8C|nr:SHOCT domain-containing protein [Gottfriedia luciferensis]
MNSHIVLNEMRKKLSEESKFTEDDLKNIAAAAKALGSLESRVTYASVKQRFNSQLTEDVSNTNKLFLDRLDALKEKGTITDDEYETQKKIILEDNLEGA